MQLRLVLLALGSGYISKSTRLPSNEFLLIFSLMRATTVPCNPRGILVVTVELCRGRLEPSLVARQNFSATPQSCVFNEQPMW
jgi:hypothetical protein